MNESAYSLILLLAASKLTRRELAEAIRDLHQNPPDELLIRVEEVRRANRRFVREQSWMGPRYRPEDRPTDAIGRVEHLLRREANLTVAQAASALITAMERDLGTGSELFVPPKRESFRKWLKRMTRIVSVSQLLHYATQIRNDAVHRGESDWPLREDSQPQ